MKSNFKRMKNLIATIVFMFHFFAGYSQWEVDTSFTTPNNLRSVLFVTEQDGFVIECDLVQSSWSSNWLHKTTDRETHWNSSISSEMCPGAIYFVNKDLGYIVTTGSAIGAEGMRKTTNGGNTWTKLNYHFPSSNQRGLFFVDENTGYYGSGDGFTIHKTTDGGLSWAVQNIGTNNSVIDAIHFFNKDTGIIAGWYGPKIAKTTDGGNTWNDVSNSFSVYAMHFSSETTGYAVASNNTNIPVIIKTTDAGDTWNTVYTTTFTGEPSFFSSIYCLDNNTCFTVGNRGTILKTIDGGSSWHEEISGTTKRLNSICCTKSGACYAVGDSGVALKNSVAINIVHSVRESHLVKVYPNPFATTATIELVQKMNDGILCIYNIYGQKIMQVGNVYSSKLTIDSHHLSKGVYFFTVQDNENSLNGKFIIE